MQTDGQSDRLTDKDSPGGNATRTLTGVIRPSTLYLMVDQRNWTKIMTFTSEWVIRYAVLTKETWPRWTKDVRQGTEWILRSVGLDGSHYQLGKTKVFIKAPETLFLLEEQRERRFNVYARVIQRAFKKYFAQRQKERQKAEAVCKF
ncbi:Unconventional myosin-Ie [Homalodisca vitripennis]|nr:Unconventional myosin-Ie [Homalodisca vitripennis]